LPQIGPRRIAHRRFEQFLRPVLQFIGLIPPPVRLPHGLRDPLPIRRSALGDRDLRSQFLMEVLLFATSSHRAEDPENRF
jgi:hypothetical protein